MIPTPDVGKFLAKHRDFFEYLSEWQNSLKSVSLVDLTDNGTNARRLAIMSTDLTKCFTSVGRLASPRIAAIVPNVVKLFEDAHALGVSDFLLTQDSHPRDSLEFEAFGEHCVEGTSEAETVDELKDLPFSNEFTVMLKDSLNPAIGTDVNKWVDDRPEIKSIIVVGDCTDICVYQLAMHIKIRSVQMHRRLNVIIPTDCVQTYHFSVEEAKNVEAMPHDGDLMHVIFLYHMALCGIHVVSNIE